MTGPGLFDPGAPRLRTIPPGANFLAELARALVAEKEVSVHPDALADDLIYVPNRRSARALALAIYRASGIKTLLMPEIRPLGDLETDEPPPGVESALADLPPALSGAERLGQLSRLVSAYYERQDTPVPPASALAAAAPAKGVHAGHGAQSRLHRAIRERGGHLQRHIPAGDVARLAQVLQQQ